MADLAANVAMDSFGFLQALATSGRDLFTRLQEHLDNDVRQWFEHNRPTTTQNGGPV